MHTLRSVFLLTCTFFCFQATLLGQTLVGANALDPAGVIPRIVGALAGGSSTTDVTLTGTATLPNKVSGTIVLKAHGAAYSRMDLVAGDESRIEIRGLTGNRPVGWWKKDGNPPSPMALHNCLAEAAWFFPLFAIQRAQEQADVSVSSITTEQLDSAAVVHLSVFRPRGAQSQRALAAMKRLSSADVYVDTQTLLPRVLKYNLHPDNDASTNIAVEVRFADYRVVSGVQVPFRIQKLMNGALMLDVVVSGAAINTGVPVSAFTLD